ncbi:MAG: ABC transporter substrate-binding protein [Clostridiales bacterium]|nr:ABC transporter substrate-binding protein [Clostridiales bacterium]
MKRKACIIATAILVGVCLLVSCIYAVVSNFGKNKNDVTVFIPDGAPALAMAKLLSENTENDGVNYTVVSATGIEARVTYKDTAKNADVCVLPLTDASLHLNDGEDYQLLGVVTHGNFFLISETEQKVYKKDNLSELIGRRIGFVQLGKLPGLVFRSVLERESVPYKIQTDFNSLDENAVNLVNVKPTDVKKGVGVDVFIVPEPLATAKINAGFHLVGSMQDLYGGENGYPQAVVVAKRSLIETNSDWVKSFVDKLKENEEWLKTASLESVLSAINTHLETGLTPAFTDKNLSKDVIERCGVRYAGGSSSKEEIIALIENLKRIDENSVKSLSDGFFNEMY